MENVERSACAHSRCECSASEDSSYCSSYCENASLAATHEGGCNCGHAGCEQRGEFQPRFSVG